MAKPAFPSAESYRDAAAERCAEAATLLDRGHYGSAIWLSGVSLECLFRAYHRRISDQLNTGHDLKVLWRDSRFADYVANRHDEHIAQAIGQVIGAWRHRYRYDPTTAVRRRLGLSSEIELARLARKVVNAAHEVVNHGVSRWQ